MLMLLALHEFGRDPRVFRVFKDAQPFGTQVHRLDALLKADARTSHALDSSLSASVFHGCSSVVHAAHCRMITGARQ